MGWSSYWNEKVQQTRNSEIKYLSARKYLDAFCVFCVFFWASTPVVVPTSVFVTVIYMGRKLTAADTFTTVLLLNRLIYPMNAFPWIFNDKHEFQLFEFESIYFQSKESIL